MRDKYVFYAESGEYELDYADSKDKVKEELFNIAGEAGIDLQEIHDVYERIGHYKWISDEGHPSGYKLVFVDECNKHDNKENDYLSKKCKNCKHFRMTQPKTLYIEEKFIYMACDKNKIETTKNSRCNLFELHEMNANKGILEENLRNLKEEVNYERID